MEKADTHNGDLSRRSDVLEERVAKMTHEKMTVEHNHELLKGENTRLRDELERVRSGNERDKEAWRRDRENRLKSLQMDHQRDLDREAFNHQKNVDSLNAVVQDKLSTNISQAWQEISDLLWSWHNYVRDKYPIISDHALYRSLNGIISCVPDEIERNDDLLKFVFSELLNEYSPFISRY